MPLELQRQAFYGFWEDVVRNILDIMANDYGQRQVIAKNNGEDTIATINYELLKAINFEVRVDIGNGAQYSEIAQVNTLDKLFQNQIIDAETYIESIPDKYVPNKGKITENVKSIAQQQRAIQQQQILPNQMIG